MWSTKIIWKHKQWVLTDYYLGRFIQLTKHIPGLSIWSVSCHRKGSHNWHGYGHDNQKPWYRGWTYRKIETPFIHPPYKQTRMTLRFGKYIVTLCNLDREAYYRTSEILSIHHWGKLVFTRPEVFEHDGVEKRFYECPMPRCEFGGAKSKEEIGNHMHAHTAASIMLDKAYPSLSWKN